MSSSNCCFLTCIQISQETGQAVWYFHLFQNFPVYFDPHSQSPIVSLSASLTKTKMAANTQRHGGHPAAPGYNRLDRYATGRCHGPIVCVRTPPMRCDFFLMYKVPCHMAALMLERWSRVYLFEHLFLFRSPLLEVLTRPCCGFKQRLGNFRETWYPEPAESSSPMDFFLGVRLKY